jgi:hypothetical protein
MCGKMSSSCGNVYNYSTYGKSPEKEKVLHAVEQSVLSV